MMNPKVYNFFMKRNPNLENATRYADGLERLFYDMEFVQKFIPQQGTVLDLCCGTGMMTVELKKHANNVYAVDFNPDFLEKIPLVDGIHVIRAEAKDFLISDVKFDLITLFGAIHYNTGKDVRKIYNNCFSMLKRGGNLIISGQWGVNGRVIIDKYSEELGTDFYAEYRTTQEETELLNSIGFSTRIEKILPERFNHYENTKFYAIVAVKA